MKYADNLLPKSWCRRLLVRRRIRQWVPVWIVGLVCCLCGGLLLYAKQVNLRAECRRLESAAAPLKTFIEQTAKFEGRLAQLEGRESLLTALEQASDPFRILGIVSESIRQTSAMIRINEYSMATRVAGRTPETQNSTAAVEPLSDEVQLELVGSAADDLAVTKFIDELRRYDVFDLVTLHSSQRLETDGSREFRITCSFAK
jgi:hypothetical protein